MMASVHSHFLPQGTIDLEDGDTGPGSLQILRWLGVGAIIGHQTLASSMLMNQRDLDSV